MLWGAQNAEMSLTAGDGLGSGPEQKEKDLGQTW